MNPWFIPFSEPRVTQNQPRAKALWCLGRGSTRVHEMPFRRPEAQAPSVPSRSCLSELPNRKKTEKTPATEKDELKNMARASRPLKKTKAHQKGGLAWSTLFRWFLQRTNGKTSGRPALRALPGNAKPPIDGNPNSATQRRAPEVASISGERQKPTESHLHHLWVKMNPGDSSF